ECNVRRPVSVDTKARPGAREVIRSGWHLRRGRGFGARENRTRRSARAEHSFSRGTSAAPDDGASGAGKEMRAPGRAPISKIHVGSRLHKGARADVDVVSRHETHIHV